MQIVVGQIAAPGCAKPCWSIRAPTPAWRSRFRRTVFQTQPARIRDRTWSRVVSSRTDSADPALLAVAEQQQTRWSATDNDDLSFPFSFPCPTVELPIVRNVQDEKWIANCICWYYSCMTKLPRSPAKRFLVNERVSRVLHCGTDKGARTGSTLGNIAPASQSLARRRCCIFLSGRWHGK